MMIIYGDDWDDFDDDDDDDQSYDDDVDDDVQRDDDYNKVGNDDDLNISKVKCQVSMWKSLNQDLHSLIPS